MSALSVAARSTRNSARAPVLRANHEKYSTMASRGWSAEIPLMRPGTYRTEVLAGTGAATFRNGRLDARIPQPLNFLFIRLLSR